MNDNMWPIMLGIDQRADLHAHDWSVMSRRNLSRFHRVDKTHRTADLQSGDIYITAQGHNSDVRYSWTLS